MNIWFTLHMDLENQEGPGWYLSATRKDDFKDPATLIEPVRLGSVDMKEIGADLDHYIREAKELQVLPSQIVGSGVHLIQEAIFTQLKLAEMAAVRAAKLKALQDAESTIDQDKDVERNDL